MLLLPCCTPSAGSISTCLYCPLLSRSVLTSKPTDVCYILCMSSQHTNETCEKGCLASLWCKTFDFSNVGRTQSCLVTTCAADIMFLHACQPERAALIIDSMWRQHSFIFFDKTGQRPRNICQNSFWSVLAGLPDSSHAIPDRLASFSAAQSEAAAHG